MMKQVSKLTLPLHLIKNFVREDMSNIKIGMANLFIQHIWVSLTVDENADPDVPIDLEMVLNKIGTFIKTKPDIYCCSNSHSIPKCLCLIFSSCSVDQRWNILPHNGRGR